MARPGQKALALSALAPWRSCGPLISAATPLNDSGYLYAMGKSANCTADHCADSPLRLHGGHSRHYAAEKSHPHEAERRPSTWLTAAVRLSGAGGWQPSYGGSVSAPA